MAKKPKRRYSDEDRANALAALAANGGNISRTSKEIGIPAATLRAWNTGERHPEATQMCEEKKEPLADAFENIARQLIGGVTKEKIAAADAQKLMTSAGIAVDKMQLLRGKPTAINDSSHHFDELSDTEIDQRIGELETRLPRVPGSAGGEGEKKGTSPPP